MGVNRASIILGLGFGDEGKGITTDFLTCRYKNSLVVRFNGGQQAGHTVNTGKQKHVFSNFGSGTFRNAPTYWSEFCAFAPIFFINELASLTYQTNFYINFNCPITTPYDVLYNCTYENSLGAKRKGSCGLGFGATIKRDIELIFKDILNIKVLTKKLERIHQYYRYKVNTETNYDFDSFNHEKANKRFIECVLSIKKLIKDGVVIPINEKELFHRYCWEHLIFEGAQGLLLDKSFGTYPYVTKSNTSSKNALDILYRNNLNIPVNIYYVTRAYQTRHGAGPFPSQHPNFNLINTQSETNHYNKYQGEFKTNYLNLNSLHYAIKCDNNFSKALNKNIVITCLDQLETEDIHYIENKSLLTTNYKNFPKLLQTHFNEVLFSFSNNTRNLLNRYT